tara:strand:- start:152 stop:1282 length:1131 start_codon:yes stop_codon:yes gene_type:complete
MKKILFQKFIKDTFKFFIITSLIIATIVWVIQAVNFLDFVTEDGHGFKVYFSYILLSFPKMFHRILPFVFFISLFYQLNNYENKNELLIFWINGVKKKQFINIILIYSILITILQIFLGSYVSPFSQNEARSFIRSSNVDFFPSLIKEGKFIDTVSDLTIFIESRSDNGEYKNIFLKELIPSETKQNKFQIIHAKKGVLISDDNNKYFQLYDGEILNKEGNKIKSFNFDKINFNLSKYVSKTTGYPKIQEVSSYDLFNCLNLNYKKRIDLFKAKYLQCRVESINDIKEEFLKRFFKPIYLPLLALLCCVIILSSKESENYNKIRFYLFIFIFLIIVISEISLRYSTQNQIGMIFFITFPILSFFSLYSFLLFKNNL